MRSGLTDIARAAHGMCAHGLGDRALNAGSPGVLGREVGRLLTRTLLAQRLILQLRAYGDLALWRGRSRAALVHLAAAAVIARPADLDDRLCIASSIHSTLH